MSRLDRHKEKEFKKKMIWLTVALVVILIFLFTTGIKLLTNSSLFVSKIASPQESELTPKSDSFFGTVDLDSPGVATNSSRLIVTGSLTGYDSVDFYLDGEKITSKVVVTGESFTGDVGPLTPGENQIYVIAKSKKNSKETKKSDSLTVLYMNTPPKLDISEPSDNSKVNKADLKIAGTSDIGTIVRVGNAPVALDADGKFQTMTRLKDGENKITISSTDQAGNRTEKVLTVFFEL